MHEAFIFKAAFGQRRGFHDGASVFDRATEHRRGAGGEKPVGPGKILVHSKFGGQIFGFDIDQNGSEGVLSEAQDISGGKVLAAVETFDQKTGKILKVVSEIQSKDDYLTLGIVGTSVGLVEREHVTGIYVTKRIYDELNPLSGNKFTGMWTPPLSAEDIILGVSRDQGVPTTAVLYFENSGNNFDTFVFGTNVAENTFQPTVDLTDQTFMESNAPQVAYDSATNEAVIASSDGAVGGPPPKFALVDLTDGSGKRVHRHSRAATVPAGLDQWTRRRLQKMGSPALRRKWISAWSFTT